MTLSYIVTYRTSDGAIVWVTDMKPEEADHQVEALASMDLAWVPAPDRLDTALWYVSGGELVPRPVLAFDKLAISADDTDAAVLSLTVPFEAEIDGQVFQIDEADGAGDYVLELSSPMPATYRVRVRLWPYQDYDAEVVAT